ncbi:guanine nucleotide exchange factor [Dactylonectria macrodidyma]|uniref:Guanine nucleotide exchange factor n=1 Tax=Dactylonectria macrodidyma TaxID=307937 RepID=A0A9P9E807_9HYPO|nr:guanine nucleotide exchange factor [Dactylonectria macrodidyma]
MNMSEMDILKKLETEVGSSRDAALEQFLNLTRRREEHDHTILRESIAIIGRCAFEAPNVSPATRHLALRCINNVFCLSPPTRQLFVDSGFPEALLELMQQSNDADDVSLSMRLMLLCSVDTTLDLTPHFEGGNLAQIININISHHARDAFEPSLVPTLNLLSTLGANRKYESQTYRFLDSLPPILETLKKAAIPSPPLSPLVSLLISSLLAIPFDQELPSSIVDKLVDILDLALPTNLDNGEDADSTVSPLMALLLRTTSQPGTKLRLRARMIASDHDRTTVLGRGDSLPHRLIRLSAEITAPNLKQLAALLLFKLSDEDPRQLITNVGYGYGVGILQSTNTPFSPEDLETGQMAMGRSNVNPITGQMVAAETAASQPDLAEMTQEEKEREAERLFVLFERSVSLHPQVIQGY